MSVRPWLNTPPWPSYTNTASSFKEFLDLLHFENYFLPFETNSELLGEVNQGSALGIIPEHLNSEWFQVLGLRVISEWTLSTWAHPEHLDLGVFPKHLEPRCISLAPSHFLKVLHCLICNVSWPGKNGSANVRICCTLIATKLNVRLICTGALSNG